MKMFAFILLAAFLTVEASQAGRVVGPDEACIFLEVQFLHGSGWLCCKNRTLTVQGRRYRWASARRH